MQIAELARNRQKAGLMKEKIRLEGIKTADDAGRHGDRRGGRRGGQVWGPHAMTGVETPPNRPGLAVIKRVSAVEAEPGDTLTYVIFYRNMGNTPIRSVTIADSLLPRLEYVKGTSRARGYGLHDRRQPRRIDRDALDAAGYPRPRRDRATSPSR